MTSTRRTVLAGLAASAALSRPARAATPLRIGYQRSSTLVALLRQDGSLEQALSAQGVGLSWHEFTSGLPIMEALNAGSIDVSAAVADTVPVFAQAAGARITYFAQEAASPEAQGILVPKDSALRSMADLKGKRIAVTKGAGNHFLVLAALKEAGLSFRSHRAGLFEPGRWARRAGEWERRGLGRLGPVPDGGAEAGRRAGPARRSRAVALQALLPRCRRLRGGERADARPPVRQAGADRGLGKGEPGRG